MMITIILRRVIMVMLMLRMLRTIFMVKIIVFFFLTPNI